MSCYHALTVFGTLLAQGFGRKLVKLAFVLVLSLWLLCVIVISNEYSGIMAHSCQSI